METFTFLFTGIEGSPVDPVDTLASKRSGRPCLVAGQPAVGFGERYCRTELGKGGAGGKQRAGGAAIACPVSASAQAEQG